MIKPSSEVNSVSDLSKKDKCSSIAYAAVVTHRHARSEKTSQSTSSPLGHS